MRSSPPLAPYRCALLAGLSCAVLLAGCGATAPATPAAAAATAPPATATSGTPAANRWASLEAQVGRRPSGGTDFLRTGPLAERLRGLMGEVNYPVLLDNLGVSGPLQRDGKLLFITGNRPHQGGAEEAAVVIHPAADAVRVWLLTGGEEWDVQDQGTPVPLPADVLTMRENARR